LTLPACSTKQIQYIDKVKIVVPSLPLEMTEPIQIAKNPASDINDMTTYDLINWWRALRKNVEEANTKLIHIRIWYDDQTAIITQGNSNGRQ
jgi:hypothetical protein